MLSRGIESQLRWYVRTIERRPAVSAAKTQLRRLRRSIPGAWRWATSHQRALPDAVIAGVQKAGTTQLYASMVRHPRCFGATVKEVRYFSYMSHKSLAWYRSHFHRSQTIKAADGVCLEATPCYLPSPAAIARMHAAMPEAKLIVLLRDPVARAFSHFQHQKVRCREKRSFAQVVDEILSDRPDSFASDWLQQDNPEPLYGYLSRGYYALQLEMLWRNYSREQTLVLDSAELFEDTNSATQQVFDFVGLDPHPVPANRVFNRGHYRESIEPQVAERLREHYRPYDQRLAEMLGRPFRWMAAERVV